MWLVFLHGAPGAGKLTVGRELAARTGFALFHNHLVVDAVASVFEFGSAPFVELRERFWLSTFREAVRHDRSLIFTFAPERTVRPEFPAQAEAIVRESGGRVLFVALRCAEVELERRIADPSRRAFGKLDSVELYRSLRDAGAFEVAPLRADLELDVGALTPQEAARRIQVRIDSL